MKYALSSRQQPDYLELADEIRVQYRDREVIYDFIDKYPNKTIILEIPFYIEEESIDFEEINTLNKLVKDFMCRVSRIEDMRELDELDVRWYYGMVIDKWDDLACLATTNSAYVLIGGDLFFDLARVKRFGIPIRSVPNVSTVPSLINVGDLKYDISIVGDWFQPEAVSIYEEYIDAIEFENCNLQQERALYRIYAKNGWPGNLTEIITNLNTDAEGRLINPVWFYTSRLDCQRKCISHQNSGCQLCYRQFFLGNYERISSSICSSLYGQTEDFEREILLI